MARGYEGSFGHLLNAAYVWIPLSLVFFFGLFDWRRPRRWAHLDLLVLLSFSVSQIFFNDANIGVSVPLAYPPLLYLLARMLWVGFRGPGDRPAALGPGRVARDRASSFCSASAIALNIADSGVIDVGYAGVIGADRVVHGEPLYGEGAFPDDNRFGDTYGPLNYYVYVPFELVLPWSGDWDELPAAHAAAIFFDLALRGAALRARPPPARPAARAATSGSCSPSPGPRTRTRPTRCSRTPTTRCVAALILGALLVIGSPPARGALAALAGPDEVRAVRARAAARRGPAGGARVARRRDRGGAGVGAAVCWTCASSRSRWSWWPGW